MSGSICAESLNWSCAPPPPFYGSPAVSLFLLAAPAAAMIIWLWRNLAPLEEFADQIPPIAGPPQLPEEQPQSPQLQIPAAPRLPDEQPCRVRSILDANQVPGAIDAISSSMEENIRPISAPWPPQAESSICDGSGSSSSDDGRNHMVELFQYPSIDSLEAGDARLIDANYMVQAQEMIRGLPEAARVEIVRRAFRYTEEESRDLYRLSHVHGNSWILHTDTKTLADPCKLTKGSTRSWVVTLKSSTKLLCLIWRQLDGQNWQLCQELKEEFFAEVAGESVEKLLEVARLFSDARWSFGHTLQMLSTFDALVDVLSNIRDLSFSRFEFIPNEVDDIFRKMVSAFRRILEETTNDMHSRKGYGIHPATYFLREALEFFYRNRDIVQSILVPGDYIIDLHYPYMIIDCWVSKLKADAERIFKDQKDRQYIVILNNTYYVWQMKCRPGGFLSNEELTSRFNSLIRQYSKSYFDQCWVPLVSYLEVGSRSNPRHSSLGKFSKTFFSTCERKMKWKVLPELKRTLRDDIVGLVVPQYNAFLIKLQTNPSSAKLSLLPFLLKRFMSNIRKTKGYIYTGEQLEKVIRDLYES